MPLSGASARRHSNGIGIAIKVADGQKRGLYPAVVAVLDALGLLDATARAALAPWAKRTIRNYRGIETGEIRPAVALITPKTPSAVSRA